MENKQKPQSEVIKVFTYMFVIHTMNAFQIDNHGLFLEEASKIDDIYIFNW